jgi:O-antigen/teichoic acid export membrane protein
LFSTLVGAVATYASPWTLQGAAGAVAVARFSALATMLNLTNPVMITISGLIVPAVAAARSQGAGAVRGVAVRYALLGAVLLLPYLASLMLMPRLALTAFYGPASPYLGLTLYLRLFVAGYAMVYGVMICTGVLNGLEQSRGTFLAATIASAATAVTTVPLTIRFGLIGATIGGIPPIILQLLAAGWMLRRATRCLKEPGAPNELSANREPASGEPGASRSPECAVL